MAGEAGVGEIFESLATASTLIHDIGVVVLLALAIVDRRLDPPEGKGRKSGQSKRR